MKDSLLSVRGLSGFQKCIVFLSGIECSAKVEHTYLCNGNRRNLFSRGFLVFLNINSLQSPTISAENPVGL
jgi:hypothetical protein